MLEMKPIPLAIICFKSVLVYVTPPKKPSLSCLSWDFWSLNFLCDPKQTFYYQFQLPVYYGSNAKAVKQPSGSLIILRVKSK